MAEETKPKATPGHVTLEEIRIVGKRLLPQAAASIGAIPMTRTLSELRQPFIERIEAAIEKDPF